MSSEFAENWILPWLNSWLTCFKAVPWPITEEAFWRGDVAKISPKSALYLLNPVVPTFAILLLVTLSDAVAAFSPVSAV